MNDKIKKILAYFEEYVKITDMHDSEPMLNWKDLKIVLDYITNLQQKVEQYENPEDLTLFYMWIDEKAKDKMKELQQENERLKDELETMTFTAKVKQEAIDALIKRIDKAVEYIAKHKIEYEDKKFTLSNIMVEFNEYANPQALLDILKGDSDV